MSFVAAALTRAGLEIDALLQGIDADNSAALMSTLLRFLGQRLVDSSWSQGCPVATVALEISASNEQLQRVCAATYSGWAAILRDKLAAEGHASPGDLATTLLALLEGALLLARAHRSTEPLDAVGRSIELILQRQS